MSPLRGSRPLSRHAAASKLTATAAYAVIGEQTGEIGVPSSCRAVATGTAGGRRPTACRHIPALPAAGTPPIANTNSFVPAVRRRRDKLGQLGGLGKEMNFMKPDLHFVKHGFNFMKPQCNIIKHGFNIMKHRFHFFIRPPTAAHGRAGPAGDHPQLSPLLKSQDRLAARIRRIRVLCLGVFGEFRFYAGGRGVAVSESEATP